MKQLFVICLFVSFSIISGALPVVCQTNDTINAVDENNMKQGYWIVYDKTNTYKIEEGNYSNNRKTGVWKGYYPSGKIKHEITYVNGRPNGYAKFYYESGIVSEEGVWKGNKWVGDYKYYHKNGQTAYEWKYNESGKRTGVQKYYHENGQLMIEGEWNAGKEVGVIKEYYADGSLRSEKFFNNGKVDSASVKIYKPATVKNTNTDTGTKIKITEATKEPKKENLTYFTGNGQHTTYKMINGQRRIDQEGVFKDGRLQNGKKYTYNSQGILTKTTIYNNGRIINIIYAEEE